MELSFWKCSFLFHYSLFSKLTPKIQYKWSCQFPYLWWNRNIPFFHLYTRITTTVLFRLSEYASGCEFEVAGSLHWQYDNSVVNWQLACLSLTVFSERVVQMMYNWTKLDYRNDNLDNCCCIKSIRGNLSMIHVQGIPQH